MSRSAVRKDDEILQEAVDQLAKIIEINPEEWMKAKTHEKKRFWIDITNAKEVNQSIKSTLHLIYEYLRKNFPTKKDEFDAFSKKGFSAIWVLAQEAVDKIDQINSLFHTEVTQSVRDSKEYKELEMALQQKLSRHTEDEFEIPSELSQGLETEANLAVKTLDAVKKDQQYELFYIKQEDGTPFFSPQLVKNVKLLIDFERMILSVDAHDPFISLPVFQDRVVFSLAKSIKESANQYISSYMKIYHRFSKNEVAQSLYKAIIALDLAAMSDNRIDAKKRKVCSEYFQDFLHFLHKAINHPEYYKITHEFHETHSDLYRLAQMARALSFYLFTAVPRGQFEQQYLEEMKGVHAPQKGHIWQRLADQYAFIQDKLKSFPSGPLMKVLDFLSLEEKPHVFNPFEMKNYPRHIYGGKHEKGGWECIHLPAPVQQVNIQQSPLLKEFTEALAYMEENHHRKWIVFNLQDRTSYFESARAKALEELQYRAPYQKVLSVVTLPKTSEFYHQSGYYAEMNSAETFLATFLDQFSDYEISGFFFPKELPLETLIPFCKTMLHWMHKRLFNGIEIMHRELRQDFIEIFFTALAWKIASGVQPSLVSFTSKDGVDIGAASEAGFYAFLLLLQNKLTLDMGEKMEILSWLPALFQRERLLEEEVFHRLLRALSTLDANLQKNPELHKEFLEQLELKHWKIS